jgi:hypothetical protein
VLVYLMSFRSPFPAILLLCWKCYGSEAPFPSIDVERSYWIGSNSIEDVVVSPNGDVTMLGTTLRITTIDAAGNLIKDVQAGNAIPRSASAMSPDGAVFAYEGDAPVGKYISKYLPDQKLAWTTNYVFFFLHDFLPTPDGGTFILTDNLRLTRFNNEGVALWAKDIPGGPLLPTSSGGPSPAQSDMRAVPQGGYVIASTTVNGDIRVIRLDDTGGTIWDKTYGGSGLEDFSEIHLIEDGGFIIAATSQSGVSGTKISAARGGKDLWVLTLDSSGNVTAQASFGGTQHDLLKSIARTSYGYAILAESLSPPNGMDKTAPAASLSGQPQVEWLLLLDHQFAHLADESYSRIESFEQRRAFIVANADGTLLRLAFPHRPNIRRFRFNYTPSIQATPPDGAVLTGKSATLKVLEYSVPGTFFQWSKDGQPLLAATNSTLMISNFTLNEAGSYTVRLTNQWGAVTSSPIALSATDVAYQAELLPSLVIEGQVGMRYRIDSRPGPDTGSWEMKAEITLTNSPQRWLDLDALEQRRVYRVRSAP